ncbi:hypothetical protein [Calycomorphotria hydatis]|uniref:Uncharacterized protein n=1 Tax=Calycomorphotria hydatis TaxID=2528027 RepID=A0A517TAH7_9PLAN|nr:hypothetical protein [Calycomorphotria hydatis]QDT65381.1 hypothetical protein V22_26340 [Calycomorphotria hydatis]
MQPLSVNSKTQQPCRRGYALPMIGCGVLVAMAVTGWTLENFWLRNTREELNTTAEAAALAAARQLANDETLKAYPNWQLIRSDARRLASEVGINSHVCGEGVYIEPNNGSDVFIGSHTLPEFGFGETGGSAPPDYVRVFARRTKEHSYPIPLLAGGLVGKPSLDMMGVADAEVNRHVVGLAATDSFAIPAYSMAIRQSDNDGQPVNDWQHAIIDRNGADDFGWDEFSGKLLHSGDGIPEIVLTYLKDTPPNFAALSFGGNNSTDDVGLPDELTRDELASFGGELIFEPRNSNLDFVPADRSLSSLIKNDLTIGKSRIAFLYLDSDSSDSVRLTGMVAIRVLKIMKGKDGWKVIAQPTVVATPTAVIAADTSNADHNPYICKVHLAHPEH